MIKYRYYKKDRRNCYDVKRGDAKDTGRRYND